VKKGQLIARLDRDQLTAQRDSGAAGLSSSQDQLAQAATSLAWERETLAADIQQRRADLAAAEARLAELKNGSRPQEIQEAKAAVDAAQSEFDRAKKDWTARRRSSRTTTSPLPSTTNSATTGKAPTRR